MFGLCNGTIKSAKFGCQTMFIAHCVGHFSFIFVMLWGDMKGYDLILI